MPEAAPDERPERIDPRAAVEAAIVASPFGRRLGARTGAVEPDRCVVHLPFDPENVTVGDMLHGGAIAALIDIAATGAAWSAVDDPLRHRGTTIGLTVSYLAGARASEIAAEARVRRRGGSVCFIDVAVRDGAGTEIATAQVTYKLARLKSPGETLAGLFAGGSEEEQQALLATLERGGAALYRQWAKNANADARRVELEKAARREIENAELLEGTKK